jgi:hypothetical protein
LQRHTNRQEKKDDTTSPNSNSDRMSPTKETETKPKVAGIVVDPESQPLLLKGDKATDIPSNSITSATIGQDAWDIIVLGVPIFVAMVSWVGVRLCCFLLFFWLL